MNSKKLVTVLGSICLIIVLAAMALLPACAAPAPPASKPSPTPAPAPTPTAEVVKWKMQTFAPPAMSLYARSFMTWVDMVKKSTNGRVIIEPHPPAALVPVSETFTALKDGVIDGAYHVGQYNVGVWQGFGVEDTMPLAYIDWRDQMAFMWGDYEWKTPYEDFIRAKYTQYGIHYLTAVASDINLILSKKPLRTLADLKGLKLRATGQYSKWLTKLGATTVMAPLAEVYTGLATGTFDGLTTGFGGHVGMKLYENAKYAWWPPVNGMVAHMAISMKSWNKLPPDLQQLMTLTARDWANWHNRVEWPAANYTEGYDVLKAKGVSFTSFDEMDKAQQAAIETWNDVAAVDADAAKAVDMLKSFMKLKGYLK